ncbi:MAG: 30S ribosomal protein S8 [Candidatus Kerfeldbacteria bacterium]|nr:30S ribosomal protein S8 [Candidatus Kerfeldbacteria bacterium]
MTDPISDMLTRIRNALLARQTETLVPYSKVKAGLANILQREGYLAGVEEINNPYRSLLLKLKYQSGQPAIRNLKRISKPGNRRYVKSIELPRVLSGLGTAIISTSQGLLTVKEAKQRKLGGEVICEIY